MTANSRVSQRREIAFDVSLRLWPVVAALNVGRPHERSN